MATNLRKLGIAAAMGAVMMAGAPSANAAFFVIDLTTAVNPDGSLAPVPATQSNPMYFGIPTQDQLLIATPTNPSGVGQGSALIDRAADGIGVKWNSADQTFQVDNGPPGAAEQIQFTLTVGDIGEFRLAAIEFTNVDANDNFRLTIDGAAHSLAIGTTIAGNSTPTPCTTTSCWVYFLPGGPGFPGTFPGLGTTYTLANMLGTTFLVGTASASDSNDDWRIRSIVWEIDDPVTTPEPATMVVIAAGLLGLATARIRRRKPTHG